MTAIVTVHIKGVSAERLARVQEEHPEVWKQLEEASDRTGVRMISHRRLYRDHEFLDIDEWPSADDYRAWRKAADPAIRELARLRGTEIPQDHIWEGA